MVRLSHQVLSSSAESECAPQATKVGSRRRSTVLGIILAPLVRQHHLDMDGGQELPFHSGYGSISGSGYERKQAPLCCRSALEFGRQGK